MPSAGHIGLPTPSTTCAQSSGRIAPSRPSMTSTANIATAARPYLGSLTVSRTISRIVRVGGGSGNGGGSAFGSVFTSASTPVSVASAADNSSRSASSTPPPAAAGTAALLVASSSAKRRDWRSGPASRTTPSASTTTSSQRCTEDSRCATMTPIRPSSSRSVARCTQPSVTGSIRAVASSRITTCGSRTRIRAKATSCSCPADSLYPPSPSRVSRPSGSPADQPVRPSS